MDKISRGDAKKGILIIDDHEDIVFAYERYLRRKGFNNVYTATTRIQAFQLIERHIDKISIVVLDWILDNHKDCREIITYLNASARKPLSLIFMSTRVDVPKEYYTQYIDKKFNASRFFTSKDAFLLYEEIKKALPGKKIKNRVLAPQMCTA
ncbi:response regulator transcription factor [candidate division KSB1 bacterium]|nr:response regulator transcription factor [candidate division KSB1 bacterium]